MGFNCDNFPPGLRDTREIMAHNSPLHVFLAYSPLMQFSLLLLCMCRKMVHINKLKEIRVLDSDMLSQDELSA